MPPDNALTNNPRPRLEYEVGAECSGSPCVLVDSYLRSLHLEVALNGPAIGPFSLSGSRALFDPTGRLPEGLNVLEARATDLVGHESKPAQSRFTIDTLPPKFLSVSPLDGSKLTQAAVTISGSVADPAANVILADAGRHRHQNQLMIVGNEQQIAQEGSLTEGGELWTSRGSFTVYGPETTSSTGGSSRPIGAVGCSVSDTRRYGTLDSVYPQA